MRARLRQIVADLPGAPDPEPLLDALTEYGRLIQREGARINLVGDRSDAFIAEQLIGGSLELLRVDRPRGHLVDVGSGAGLPGLPLALACPDLSVDLVEVRQKRVAFLRRAISVLRLPRARVVARQASEVSGGYDWAVARAFKPPVKWLPIGARLVGQGGRIGLYTTRSLWAEAPLPEGLRVVGIGDDPTGPERIVVVVEK